MYYFIKLKPSMKRLASPSKLKHNSINRTYRLLRMILSEIILSTDICIDKLTLAFCPKHTHTHFIRRGLDITDFGAWSLLICAFQTG